MLRKYTEDHEKREVKWRSDRLYGQWRTELVLDTKKPSLCFLTFSRGPQREREREREREGLKIVTTLNCGLKEERESEEETCNSKQQ